MRIPTEFMIGGSTYTTEYNAELRDRGRIGECHMQQCVVTICPYQKLPQQEETWIHEVIEAANDKFALDVHHGAITALAVAIHQAITTGKGDLRQPGNPC